MPATPVHSTAVDSSTWDGPTQTAKLETPLTTDIGNRTFAWRDPGADSTLKGSWKFIHHFVGKTGLPGSASTMACSTGIGVLNGARKGTTIPDADRQGVYTHLTAHLLDAGVKEADLPKLQSRSALHGAPPVSASQRAALYGNEDFNAEIRGSTEHRCVREMDPLERIAPQFEMREVANGTGGTSLRFTGYASVVERAYEVSDAFGPYMETISRSAFNKTLKDGADVSFLVNHSGVTMARTKSGSLQLSADSTGLYAEATLNPSRPDVQVIRAAIQDRDLDEMSFAFRATRQEWDSDYTQREIQEVNMHQGDVSVCNYGANGATAGLLDLRSRRTLASTDRPSQQHPTSSVNDEFLRMQLTKLRIARSAR